LSVAWTTSVGTALQLIFDIVDIYGNYPFKTEVLLASGRGPSLLSRQQRRVPMSPAVLRSLFQHPLIDEGLAAFLGLGKDRPGYRLTEPNESRRTRACPS
jgi:hypothetical protein